MSKHIVCIVGNPNCGKTTLFNAITGSKQEVGNWPGVTVEKKVGHYSHDGHDISLVDAGYLFRYALQRDGRG